MIHMKRYISMLVIFTMLISTVVLAVPGGVVQAEAYSPFHDVPTNHWALPHILKTELRGVISGYGNGLFKPDQTVTQLEAIVMAIRAMGLEQETDNTNNFVDTSSFNLPTSWNAKGFVSVAIKNKLVDELTFRPESGASRAWTAQLLIRMLGMENELKVNAVTNFNDDAYIPVWAKPSVALAVEKDVISGIANKSGGYDYKPNDAVTRAQLATLISRSDRYMNDVKGQLALGVIETVNDVEITLQDKNKRQTTYSLASTLAIYDDQYQSVSKDKLEINQTVRFHVDKNQRISFIELVNRKYYPELPEISIKPPANTIEGVVVQHFPKDRVLTIRDKENKLATTNYEIDVLFKHGTDGRTLLVGDIQVGDELRILVRDNVITEMYLLSKELINLRTGFIYAMDLDRGFLTLEKNNRYTAYAIADRVAVEYEGIRFPTVRDLQLGDEIEVTVEEDVITGVKIIKPYERVTMSGTIVTIADQEQVLTIRKEDWSLQAFQVTDATKYTLQGVDNPQFSNLRAGDVVDISAEQGKIISIAVKNRTYVNEITGEIVALDEDREIVTIEDKSGELKTYKLDKYIRLDIGIKNPELDDLSLGTNVTLELDGNIVRAIIIQTEIKGTIESADKNRNFITIRTEQGISSYNLSNNVDIEMFDVRYPEIADLKKGQKVTLHLDQNRVDRIEVEKSITVKLEEVNTSSERIDVKIDGSSKRYYIYSGMEYIIKGVSNPKLRDFREDDVVKLTFVGSDLKVMELIPPVYATISSINNNGTQIVIQTREEKKTLLVRDLQVYAHNGNKTSASNLKAGDFIRLIELDEEISLYQARVVEGELYTISTSQGRVYYYDSNRNYRNLTLAYNLLIWEGTKYIQADDLKQGTKVVMYELEGNVMGIQAK